MDKIRTTVLHDILNIPYVVERYNYLARFTRFGNRAMNEVGPVAQLIQEHRQPDKFEFTPLVKFETNVIHGPAVNL